MAATAHPSLKKHTDTERDGPLGADLGCNVVWCAAEGGGGDPIQDALLAHAEVGQLTVALCVEQDVVQLQVSGRERRDGRVGELTDTQMGWGTERQTDGCLFGVLTDTQTLGVGPHWASTT